MSISLPEVRRLATAEVAKHRRLLTSSRDGRVLSGLMLPLMKARPTAGYGVLTTTGRKTGRRRSRCVRVVRDGQRAYLTALRPPNIAVEHPDWVNAWVHNIRADSRVWLRIRGGRFSGTAAEITDPVELQRARELLCGSVFAFDYAECAVHMRGVPSREKITALHTYWFSTGNPVVIAIG